MAQQNHSALALWRRKQVEAESGHSRSTLYRLINEGLWPRPINIGPRSVAWLAGEVAVMNAARIQGKSDDEIRALVVRLEQARKVLNVSGETSVGEQAGTIA